MVEKESVIFLPDRWIFLSICSTFLLFSSIGFFARGGFNPPNGQFWIVNIISGGFLCLGTIGMIVVLRQILLPARVKHFESDAVANVPREPVLQEGSIVHGRVTHELVETEATWELRPQARLWTQDKRFLLGFGVPFLLIFAGILSWAFRVQMGAPNWPVAIAGAVCLTMICGASTFVLIGMLIRSSYQRLSRLIIPKDGSDLEFDSAKRPDEKILEPLAGIRWALVDTGERSCLKIPAETVRAIQLCAWLHKVGPRFSESTTSAVQGNLVLEDNGSFARIPLLVTADCVGAARLLRDLAAVTKVPFLFHAAKEDWREEKKRSRTRPSLKTGGSMS